ncbi:MAG: gliding motility-associated C-terminal domain-containing protein [Saprospiraceae bacterium]
MKFRLHYFLFLFACIEAYTAKAQPSFKKMIDLPDIGASNTWAFGLSVAAFSPDEFIVAGFQHKGPARDKAVMCVLNADGDISWSKTYASSTYNEQIEHLIRTADGGILALLDRSSSGGQRTGIMKTDAQGNILWCKSYVSGETGGELARTIDGNYVFCGSAFISGTGNAPSVTKIDGDGNIIWAKAISLSGTYNKFNNLAVAPDGSIYVSGNYRVGESRNLVVKFSNDGNLLWCRNFDAGSSAITRDISVLIDGTVIIGGLAKASRPWLLHIDEQGNLLSSAILESVDPFSDISNICLSPDDKVAMTLSSGVLAMTTPSGDPEWAYQYNTNISSQGISLFRVENIAGGGYLATGIFAPGTFNSQEILVMRVDSEGMSDICCPIPTAFTKAPFPVLGASINVSIIDFGEASNLTLLDENVLSSTVSLCKSPENDVPLTFELSRDTICPSECVDLSVSDSISAQAILSWTFPPEASSDSSGTQISLCIANSGKYPVTLIRQNGSCLDSFSRDIVVRYLGNRFPNAFTPNGDGLNDIYRPILYCPVFNTAFTIYNRWGQKVFETRDPGTGWDGTVDGEEAPSDVYTWILEYETMLDGVRQRSAEKGDVALLR